MGRPRPRFVVSLHPIDEAGFQEQKIRITHTIRMRDRRMHHVARVHTTWASSIDPSSRVIESYITRYALQLTTLIPHHVQPRSRGTMTRSSPFPRRLYEDSHSTQITAT
jgi:hypothetical protein